MFSNESELLVQVKMDLVEKLKDPELNLWFLHFLCIYTSRYICQKMSALSISTIPVPVAVLGDWLERWLLLQGVISWTCTVSALCKENAQK